MIPWRLWRRSLRRLPGPEPEPPLLQLLLPDLTRPLLDQTAPRHGLLRPRRVPQLPLPLQPLQVLLPDPLPLPLLLLLLLLLLAPMKEGKEEQGASNSNPSSSTLWGTLARPFGRNRW